MAARHLPLPSLPFCVSTTTSAPTISWALRTSPGLCGKTMGRGDEASPLQERRAAPTRRGDPCGRPPCRAHVRRVDAHIRPLPRGSRAPAPWGLDRTGGHKAALQEHRAAQTHRGDPCGRPRRAHVRRGGCPYPPAAAGFPLRHPGDWTERAAIKAAPTGTPGGPNA